MNARSMIWKAGCLLLTLILTASWIRGAGSGPTAGRLVKFDDAAGTLTDSAIREDDAGHVAIGARPHPQLGMFVNGDSFGVRSTTESSLGALVVSQAGAGPIATFRTNDTDVRATIDANGIDIEGSLRIGGEEVFDSEGRLLANDNLNATSPHRIALERWYDFNPTNTRIDVGNTPEAIVFDGAHVWVASSGDATVTKIRAADAAVVATYPIAGSCYDMVYDGMHVWIANSNSDSLTKIRAADGVELGTYTVGNVPAKLAFDGTHVWSANFGAGTVSKVRASNGSVLATYPIGTQPSAIAFDGSHVWVADASDNTVRKVDPNDGTVVSTAPVGSFAYTLTFDGTSIWATNYVSQNVTRIRASDATVLDTIDTGSSPSDAVFDGSSIWIATSTAVLRVRARDGVLLDSVPIAEASGLAFDGANIWAEFFAFGEVAKL